MNFYKDHYDVIIMGAGLAGLSCALQLQSRGIKDILILEKPRRPRHELCPQRDRDRGYAA